MLGLPDEPFPYTDSEVSTMPMDTGGHVDPLSEISMNGDIDGPLCLPLKGTVGVIARRARVH